MHFLQPVCRLEEDIDRSEKSVKWMKNAAKIRRLMAVTMMLRGSLVLVKNCLEPVL
jgi:hypothetical protein